MALQPLNFTKAVSTSGGRLSAITATESFAASSRVSLPASSAIEPEASITKTTSGASQGLRAWIAASQLCFGAGSGGGGAAAATFGGVGGGGGGGGGVGAGFASAFFGSSTFFGGSTFF